MIQRKIFTFEIGETCKSNLAGLVYLLPFDVSIP